jgi:hypothetical protein
MMDSIPFPHPKLTPIIGKPTAATLKHLKKEVYANARSVHSDLGGGLNGHLGIVMANAPYILRAGQMFDAPMHPGPQAAHAANATQAQILAADWLYDKSKTDFARYNKVRESIKQQILAAVNSIYYQDLEDDEFGYADVTIPNIITHLTTTYGQLTAADLEKNRAKLTEQWNPGDPIEDLWKRIRVIRSVATAGGNDINDGATIELTLEALQKAGVYDHAITTWYDKDTDDHTWANFILHFNKHEKEGHRKMTARMAGFHGANNAQNPVTPEKQRTPDDEHQANNANEGPSTYKSNIINHYYCWTHGLSRNAGHTSSNCDHKAKNHQDTATVDNRMGGVNKISFGRSGKPRQHKHKE